MNKLPKEKRDRLILVIVGTLAVLGLIYFGLISPQYGNIDKIKLDIKKAKDNLISIENSIKTGDATTSRLIDVSYTLSHAEDDMESGDTIFWTYDTIHQFKAPYKVEIPVIGQPATGEVDLLGNFPYKQVKFNISGTAYYHDLGKFISDFENNFPHMRIVNLVLDPAGASGDDSEKLSFRMDIIALIKSSSVQK